MTRTSFGGRVRDWAAGIARRPEPSPLLRVGLRVVLAAEVAAATAWALRRRVRPVDPGDVTLVVKTFERPGTLARMLRSVRRVYSGPIAVADDSRVPYVSRDPLVTVLALPFDSGVAAGRNALIDAVGTEFIWMADDDMILLPDFDLSRVIAYLQRNPDVDLCGGRVVNLPQLETAAYLSSDLLGRDGSPIRPLGTLIDGLPVTLKAPNWYVARTASVAGLRYDDQLKRVEHNDFFSRAHGRLVCVLDARMVCLHSHAYFNTHYLSFRQDTAADLAYLARKWGGRGTVSSDDGFDLDDDQRRVLHRAALQVVATDVGVLIVHVGGPQDAVAVVTDTPGGQQRLVDGLLTLGWRHEGSGLTHHVWGSTEIRAAAGESTHGTARASFASIPGLVYDSTDSVDWPEPTIPPDVPEQRIDWIRWAARAGWLETGDAIIAAALPVGPVYTLSAPGDLIWRIVGAGGNETTAVVAETLAAFDDAPPEAEQQVGDYLEILLSRALLEKV